MNPDNQRPKIEPSKEFVKELDTKEVLSAPAPEQSSPFAQSEPQSEAAPAPAKESVEPVLESVLHHSSRPLEAPLEPRPEEVKKEKLFAVAGRLIVVFAALVLLWTGWNAYVEINNLLGITKQSSFSSLPTLAYIPAALAAVGVLASIGMFFKKSIARIVYIGVAIGYLCLAAYYLYIYAAVVNVLGGSWTSLFSLEFLNGPGGVLAAYIATSVVALVFLFNKHIRAAFWR